jgi:ribonucleoside-diphosphate reductase alpha chain
MVSKIRKRDGRTVEFDKEKITQAIFKAARAVGGRDKKLAEALADRVVAAVEEKFKDGIPGVEDVQDFVEKILIEEGHARTAKAYILYRQKRAELRKEKKQLLEKEKEIDEVDKQFDLNALRVLKSRYLRKDERGKLIEDPKMLFTRVAIHVALPEILYDAQVFSKEANAMQWEHEEFDAAAAEGKYAIGEYALNRFHLKALKRTYDRFNKNKMMKIPWNELLGMLERGEFDSHEARVKEFFELMVSKKFLPNTPTLANFGGPLGMGSACFAIDVEDSIESIMDALKQAAVIFKSGGGLGYNFSKLRPEGDFVSTTSGIASGPITFMTLFDKMTEVIKQGGIRRGANMGILNSNHPDIEKFVTAKAGNQQLTNFNISVLIMPGFWEHYEKNTPYPLVNPRNGQIVRYVNPRILFDMIVFQAWESAEPGVIFFDRINEYNPFLKSLGPIMTTNPCAEVLLYPYESCNLGSINVWAFASENDEGEVSFDWNGLKETILLATRFLDDVVDVNQYPLQRIEDTTLGTRKIGLGMMGLGDLLYELGIPYNSKEGQAFMEKLMEFINYYSKVESVELARHRGPLPLFKQSFYPEGGMPFKGFYEKDSWHFEWDKLAGEVKQHGIRNGFTTVIAPTGSISMIAGASSGIEPVYSLVFEKNVKVGSFFYIDPVFEKMMRREGLYDEDLMKEIADNHGGIQKTPYIPPKMKKVFVTAMDISPEDHIRALAAFQKWVDSSISKTNNFPANATVEHMRESYLLAYRLGCKDVTVFRDTSIKEQVLVALKRKENKNDENAGAAPPIRPAQTALQPASQKIEFCPNCGAKVSYKEGCVSCPACAWGLCTSG